MRFILLILFLYIIPLVILFKNNKNLKRSFTYGSIYVVLASIIVMCNMYLSGVDKIKDMIRYNYYAYDEPIINERNKNKKQEKKDINVVNDKKEDTKEETKKETKEEIKEETKKEEFVKQAKTEKETVKIIDDSKNKIKDSDIVFKFKQDIYDIEREALVPMRDCIPAGKELLKDLSRLDEAKKDVKYAKKKCREVINKYANLKIPKLKNTKYESDLMDAKINVQKAYVLREKAMGSGEKLLNSKNPKHLGEAKEYLALSDKYIKKFVDTMKLVQNNIE